MFNLICAAGFIISLVFTFILKKSKKSELVLKALSVAIAVYKLCYYIGQNVKGSFSIPVEISSISYFLMCIILIFKIKALYGVGAFYGIVAGLGYFGFYMIFGFTVEKYLTVKEIIIGCFSHGYLLISGICLFENNKFCESDKLKVWITIFAMLSWALVFYDIEMRGITFIYYVIKPEFLFVSDNMSVNGIIMIAYYAALVFAFGFAVKLFFKFNSRKINSQKTLKTAF